MESRSLEERETPAYKSMEHSDWVLTILLNACYMELRSSWFLEQEVWKENFLFLVLCTHHRRFPVLFFSLSMQMIGK
jgi:hypothetical protein